MRAAPNDLQANNMRAEVLTALGPFDVWGAGPRSAAELKEAATHFERAAALCPAPALEAALAHNAALCRGLAVAEAWAKVM